MSGRAGEKNHPIFQHLQENGYAVCWLVASVELDVGTCGDGLRGKEGGEGGLFRDLGGQMDKLCSVGGWLWG